jgi:hypothetical protein
MKKTIQLLAIMLPQIIGSWSTHAQGSLTPPGAPAPTMKTLQQVEPRTPISSVPFAISQPGSYYLTTNLTVSSGSAITIATNGVTLDLNGYTIRSTANPANGPAIMIGSGLRNLAILNGNIEGGVTYSGGLYSGTGFGNGIYYSGTPPRAVRVSGVSVSGCLNNGIYVGNGDSTVVESCAVQTVGLYGIVATVVKNCTALECGSRAVSGATVSDCRGESTGSGDGVYATTAQNCYGSSGSGYGVYALRTAIGCYGQSSSGPAGLYAQNANTCVGYRSGGGTAISATIANGCYAASGTNNITYKYNMP